VEKAATLLPKVPVTAGFSTEFSTVSVESRDRDRGELT
jgi:hypothetical protein